MKKRTTRKPRSPEPEKLFELKANYDERGAPVVATTDVAHTRLEMRTRSMVAPGDSKVLAIVSEILVYARKHELPPGSVIILEVNWEVFPAEVTATVNSGEAKAAELELAAWLKENANNFTFDPQRITVTLVA